MKYNIRKFRQGGLDDPITVSDYLKEIGFIYDYDLASICSWDIYEKIEPQFSRKPGGLSEDLFSDKSGFFSSSDRILLILRAIFEPVAAIFAWLWRGASTPNVKNNKPMTPYRTALSIYRRHLPTRTGKIQEWFEGFVNDK